MNSNIETLASVRIEPTADVYKIVDLLNRTLKSQDLMFVEIRPVDMQVDDLLDEVRKVTENGFRIRPTNWGL